MQIFHFCRNQECLPLSAIVLRFSWASSLNSFQAIRCFSSFGPQVSIGENTAFRVAITEPRRMVYKANTANRGNIM